MSNVYASTTCMVNALALLIRACNENKEETKRNQMSRMNKKKKEKIIFENYTQNGKIKREHIKILTKQRNNI